MRRKFLAALCLAVVLSLSACGGSDSKSSDSQAKSEGTKTESTDSGSNTGSGEESSKDLFVWNGTAISGLTDEGKKQTSLVIPSDCTNISGIILKDSQVESLSFANPDTVFDNLVTLNGTDTLKSVDLPKNLKSVPSNCFANCKGLEKISLPDGVETIGHDAFTFCEALTEVTMGDNVKTIENRAFKGCKALKQIKLSAGLETVENDVFSVTGLESIELPEGVKIIGTSSFKQCAELKTAVLPSTLEKIGEFSFASCTNLESLTAKCNPVAFNKDNENGSIDLFAGMFSGVTNLTLHVDNGSTFDQYFSDTEAHPEGKYIKIEYN